MREDEIKFGRFKKLIKKMDIIELKSLRELLDELQLYKNFSEIQEFLPNTSEIAEVWLSDLICNKIVQEVLIDLLSGWHSSSMICRLVYFVKSKMGIRLLGV